MPDVAPPVPSPQRRRAGGGVWRRRLTVTLVGLLAILGWLAVDATSQSTIARLRNIVFDSYQRLAPRPQAGAPLLVVDIDQPSLDAIGQWPWPRTTIADMLDRLAKAGAATIAFDIVFALPDRTSPALTVAALRDKGAQITLPEGLALDNDAALAQSFARAPVVAGFAISNESDAALPPPKAGFSFAGTDPKTFLPAWRGGTVNLSSLSEAASGMGFFSFPPSGDGVVRAMPLVALAQGQLYPALAIEALRLAQGAGSLIVKSTGASGEADTGASAMTALKAGAFAMPTGPVGDFPIYFSGLPQMPVLPAKTLLSLSDADLVQAVQGRIVLVGTSAVGLRDLVATPIGIQPGVRVHAEIIDQVLGQVFLSRPDWAHGAEILMAALAGLLVIVCAVLGGALVGTLGMLMMAGGAAAFSWWAFTAQRLLLDPLLPGVTALLVFAVVTPVLLLWTDREKRFINAAFGRYLSPELVGRLAANPSALKLGGELREISILFSDIRDFTSISEKLTPDELTRLLNTFLTPATDALLSAEATIDKYIGDAIVAFWNAPLDIADHRRKACIGALRILAALETLNRESGRHLKVGIGLHAGVCAVGNFGSAQRFSYSAIGDSMNLAARVESLTKQYRVPILVTEAMREGAPEFATLEADLVRVVGRAQPVAIHALVGDADVAATPAFAALAAHHRQMIAAYRTADLAAARAARDRAAAVAPAAIAGLYDVYADRIAALAADPPPPGWDGVFIARQK